MDRLDAQQMGTLIEGYRRDVFRMEVHPYYAVGDDYRRWTAGETDPWSATKRWWTEQLRADREVGKTRRRVRVLSEQLTDYEVYSCAWGYTLNVEAGEDVRVLHRGEHSVAPGLVVSDFWVVDDDLVLLMTYDDDGAFLYAEQADHVEPFLAARDRAWNGAEPFGSWWTRHRNQRAPEAFAQA